jgi:hypothetical protein
VERRETPKMISKAMAFTAYSSQIARKRKALTAIGQRPAVIGYDWGYP